MKKILLSIILLLAVSVSAQTQSQLTGKQIYIPKDLQDNDFNNPDARWCYAHSRLTENFVIFWEPLLLRYTPIRPQRLPLR